MAELQSHILNDVELTARVSDSDQIVQFVEASIREAAAGVPDVSKLGLSYRSTEEEKKISLSYDGRELGSVDASDFVKDGMISDVSYDEATHVLSILWNSDGGSRVTEANLSGLLDAYTAGRGLTCENGVFSLTADIPSSVSELSNDAGYATSAYVDEQIRLSTHYYNAGDGIIIQPYFDPLVTLGPASQTIHRVKIDEDYTATKSYVRNTVDDVVISALSDIAQYESYEQVPLSAVFKSLWRLSRRSAWPEEEE